MFHGNPQHTGVSGSDVKGWTKLWTFPTGHMVRSSPAFSEGTVFIGSNDHNMYALDAESGKPKWTFKADGAVSSSAAVASSRLYFTDSTNAIYAVDVASGTLRWKRATGRDMPVVGGWDFFQSSPAVVDGIVYVGSGDGSLYAIDASTGEVKWKFETKGRVHTSPAIAGDVVVFGSMDGVLYAVNRSSKLLWKFETDSTVPFPMTGVFISSPTIAVDLGLVFAGSRDGHLYALDLKAGKLRWTLDEKGSWVIATPAYENGTVYTATSDSRLLHAVDAATGKVLWTYEGTGYGFSSPLVGPQSVYMAYWSATALSVDKSNGKVKDGNGGEGPFQSSPLVVNGVMYIGCDDGNVYAFR